jgi:hypothetical protein
VKLKTALHLILTEWEVQMVEEQGKGRRGLEEMHYQGRLRELAMMVALGDVESLSAAQSFRTQNYQWKLILWVVVWTPLPINILHLSLVAKVSELDGAPKYLQNGEGTGNVGRGSPTQHLLARIGLGVQGAFPRAIRPCIPIAGPRCPVQELREADCPR